MKKIFNNFKNLSASMHFYYIILFSFLSLFITLGLDYFPEVMRKFFSYIIVLPLNIIIFFGICFMFYRLLITGDPVKDKKLTAKDLKYVPYKYKKKLIKNRKKRRK